MSGYLPAAARTAKLTLDSRICLTPTAVYTACRVPAILRSNQEERSPRGNTRGSNQQLPTTYGSHIRHLCHRWRIMWQIHTGCVSNAGHKINRYYPDFDACNFLKIMDEFPVDISVWIYIAVHLILFRCVILRSYLLLDTYFSCNTLCIFHSYLANSFLLLS